MWQLALSQITPPRLLPHAIITPDQTIAREKKSTHTPQNRSNNNKGGHHHTDLEI